jgi:serine/threonine protein kinase
MAANPTKRLPFDLAPTKKKLLFKDRWRRALLRQISMCADNEAFKGFLEHIGSDHPFKTHLVQMNGAFDEAHSYQRAPIATGNSLTLQPDAADLVAKMMNLDPARRITAREALGHGFFLTNEEDISPLE